MEVTFNNQIRVVADNIRKVRQYHGFSQKFVAGQLGITQNGYSKLESGTVNITLARLFEIAEILGVGIIELIRDDF